MRSEIYSSENNLTAEIWKKVFQKMFQHVSIFDHVTLEIDIGKTQVNFFIRSTKDFTRYNNELSPIILKNEQDYPPVIPKAKFSYIRFAAKDNFISLREREEMRKDRKLEKIVFTVHKGIFINKSKLQLFFKDKDGIIYRSSQTNRLHIPYHFLAVNFNSSINFKKRSVPLYVKLQKVSKLFQEKKDNSLLEAYGFPYFNTAQYFSLDTFNYNRHSLILGQTGTGKSKFIQLLISLLEKNKITDEYTVVVLDPHASLYTNFAAKPNISNIDFLQSSCKLFAQIGEPKIATELTILLFKTLMKDQFNPKMERVLKYSLFVLFLINRMSLETLQTFLVDITARKEILADQKISPSIQQFFDTDFSEMQTKYYEIAIMPILTLLDELTFLPISNFQDSLSLQELVDNNAAVFLSLNKILLGEKATKLIAGLLIEQLFLLAQSKVLKKKLLFIIDEVSVVQNESLASILSEARKFNLFLFLTQQYLNQVEKPILESILTNVYNYFLFKISEDDAKLLINNLEFDFPDDQLKSAKEKGLDQKDLKIKMITTLNPRECLVRVYGNEIFYPVFKAKTIDI